MRCCRKLKDFVQDFKTFKNGCESILLLLLLDVANGIRLVLREAGPLLVVVARDHSGGFLDEDLSASPEVEVGENGLEPTVGDAVVAIEGHLMMVAVNGGREDDTSLLENDGDEGRVGHVRPGMELIRQGDPEAGPNPEVEDEEGPVEDIAVNVFGVLQNHEKQDRKGRKAVVAIGFKDIMLAHSGRSNMMLAEGTNESGTNKGGVESSPSVSSPMQNARAEVREKH